ncbi:MAG: hypothetical protein AABW81_00755 [Nanoarchaeota archaeon]
MIKTDGNIEEIKVIGPIKEEDYKTDSFRTIYADYIYNNLYTASRTQVYESLWDISIGQFRVDNIWPWGDDHITSVGLISRVENINNEKLFETVKNLFPDKKDLVKKDSCDYLNIYLDYEKIKTGGIKSNGCILLKMLNNLLHIDTYLSNQRDTLKYTLKITDELGLSTRPFSMTPIPQRK